MPLVLTFLKCVGTFTPAVKLWGISLQRVLADLAGKGAVPVGGWERVGNEKSLCLQGRRGDSSRVFTVTRHCLPLFLSIISSFFLHLCF